MNHLLSLAVVLLLGSPVRLGAQAAEPAGAGRSVLDGVFTEAQAVAGKAIFNRNCGECHAPGHFTHRGFLGAWAGRSLADLLGQLRETMPFDRPGQLAPQEYVDVIAYILTLNGLPPGRDTLRADSTLGLIRIERAPASEKPGLTGDGEWRYWGGDAGSTRYSALDQIHADNVKDLQVVWRWSAANFGPTPETYYRATPLYARGVLYTVAGERRAVAAIDPATGETLWTWRMDEGLRWEKAPRRFSGRGLAYWTDGREERVIVVTPGYYLVELDARTGRPAPGFGEDGVVDLMQGLGYQLVPWTGQSGPLMTNGDNGPVKATGDIASKAAAEGGEKLVYGIDPEEGQIGSSSPAIVVGDVIVVGSSALQGYYPRRLRNIPGTIRGFDVRSGRQLWVFNLIPRPGEFGHETWLEDSWEVAGKNDAWAPFSADLQAGLVYIPVGHPHNDWYGGHRPGDNLFSESVLALDARTGKRRWHFQMIHHDIWDYDTPTAPNLDDITVKGKRIPALVQTTKQGFAYVLDRLTGKPVWPIVERPVPRSDTPGEWTSPTQPFPSRPRAFERQGATVDELIDFTPELRAQALELVKEFRLGPLYTPVSRVEAPDGTKGTIQVPGANGGTNIMGGAAVDRETGILYVASQGGHSRIALEHNPERSEMRYVSQGPGGLRGPQGLPLLKPPYGRITAIDLNTGEHLWMIPNGDTPESVKNHPALRGVSLPRTGKSAHANVLVTKTLLFYGEGRGGGRSFHAVDKRTGEELAALELPA
ncbi:MAG: PQQ-binding-like beta-propeller repeat protein, partial [Gemmatimonadetes bacterium]|nr:PQQ-binding-like beta-propeller repeat protein [Gemmatimonadota bacterium]